MPLESKRLAIHAKRFLRGHKHKEGAPNQTDLRKAISSAYYALFHELASAGSSEFIGSTKKHSPIFALAYRSFQHGRMKQVCDALKSGRVSPRHAAALGLQTFSPEIAICASAFVELQQKRHLADYDPGWSVSLTEATALVALSSAARRRLVAADKEERRLFLALLLFDFPRA